MGLFHEPSGFVSSNWDRSEIETIKLFAEIDEIL